MSEFGNETATATLKLSEKSIEALLKLLKYLMERNERNTELELKKEKLRSMKTESGTKKARDYLNSKKGNVRANMLYKSGEKLLPISIPLSVNELREFEKYSKIYGLAYTSIADKSISEKIRNLKKQIKIEQDDSVKDDLQKQVSELEKERQKRIVIIREKDLEITKDITDRMNMDLKLKDIDSEIDLAKQKGDKQTLLKLQEEKNEINQSVFEKFNSLSNKIVIADITGEVIDDKIDFNRALSNVTDLQELNKTTILCERTKPNNFIEATSKKEISEKGREYVNTEFKVFKENQEQKCSEFSHGKFTHYSDRVGGNTSEIGDKHWENMKNEMKEKVGFSNDLLIFKDKQEYENYLKEFSKIEEKMINREDVISYEADSNSYKDCQGIINNLKGQLSEHNMMLNSQMELCNAKNKQVIHLNKNMTDDEKIQYSEGFNLANQISNYETINDLQNKIEMKKFEKREDKRKFESTENNSNSETLELYEKSQEKFNKEIEGLQHELDTCNEKAQKLEVQHKKIESIAIVGIFETEKVLEEETLEVVENINEQKKSEQTKEDWERDINVNSNNGTMTTETTQTTQTKTIDTERSIE